eukprot:GHVS01074810.1.p1 GENE.GHVS01074810.1~~GHVS01074810.1.p1  ORF type:complete len:1455 (+),score=196.19 GHVS01074810.1:459-4367(+)
MAVPFSAEAALVRSLRDLLRVGVARQVDFWSLHEELLYVAKTYSASDPPLLYLQTADERQLQIGEAYGVLAYMYLLGVPDPDGVLRFPHGWPRNVEKAVDAAVRGNRAGKCPLCYAVSGFLVALGYPPLVDSSTAWATPNLFSVAAQSVALTHDVSEGLAAPMPKLQNSSSSGSLEFVASAVFAKEKKGFDVPFISYLLAQLGGDPLGKLSVSYYLRNGLADPSAFYGRLPYSSQSSIHRPPHNTTIHCMASLSPLVDVASKALNHNGGLVRYGYMYGNEKIKEHLTKDYAEFVVNLADEGAPEGMTALGELYYHGHEAGGIERNVERASELWREAAGQGDSMAALAQAYVHLDGVQGTPQDAEPFLRQVVDTADGASAAFAEHYMYKLGLGTNQNATRAGELLKLAADQGDTNAQLLLGHSYTGAGVGVEPPGGVNNTRALHYYKLSAKQGRSVAAYNVGVLTLQGADLAIQDEPGRCVEAYGYFSKVAATHERVSLLGAHTMWAWKKADPVGAMLGSMWLSELGINAGHVNTADLLMQHGAYISGIDNVLQLLQKEQQTRELRDAARHESLVGMEETCDIEVLGSCPRDSSRVVATANGIFDEESPFALFAESKYHDMVVSFDRDAASTSFSSKVLSSATPSSNDSATSSNGGLAQPDTSWEGPYPNSVLSAWSRQDITATINHLRVAEFLRCWSRPEAFYGSADGATATVSSLQDIGSVLPFGLRETYLRTVAVAVGESYHVTGEGQRSKAVSPLDVMSAYADAMKGKIDQTAPQTAALMEMLSTWRRGHSVSDSGSKADEMTDGEIIEKFLRGDRARLCGSCSLYFMKRSAMQGDVSSVNNIIQRYLQAAEGRVAYEWAVVAAMLGDGRGLYEQANILQHGLGVLSNPALSYQIYWQLAVYGPAAPSVVYPDILSAPPPTTIRSPIDSGTSDSFVGAVALVRAAAAWLRRRVSRICSNASRKACAALPIGVCEKREATEGLQEQHSMVCEWVNSSIGNQLYATAHSMRNEPRRWSKLVGDNIGFSKDASSDSNNKGAVDADAFPLALRFWSVPFDGLPHSALPLLAPSAFSASSSPSQRFFSVSVPLSGKSVGYRLLLVWLCSMAAVVAFTFGAVVSHCRPRSAPPPPLSDESTVVGAEVERSSKITSRQDQLALPSAGEGHGMDSWFQGGDFECIKDGTSNTVINTEALHEFRTTNEDGVAEHQAVSSCSSQPSSELTKAPVFFIRSVEDGIPEGPERHDHPLGTHLCNSEDAPVFSRTSNAPRSDKGTSREGTEAYEIENPGQSPPPSPFSCRGSR